MEYETKKVNVTKLIIDERSNRIKVASVLAIVQIALMIAFAVLYFILQDQLLRTDYSSWLLIGSCVVTLWLCFSVLYLFVPKLRNRVSYIVFSGVGFAIFLSLLIIEIVTVGFAFENMSMFTYIFTTLALLLTFLYTIGLIKKFKVIKILLAVIFGFTIILAVAFAFGRFYPEFNSSYYSFAESVYSGLFLLPLMLILLHKPTHFEKVEKEIKVRVAAVKTDILENDERNSYFDGGLLQLIGWKILGQLITVLTLYICLPWAKVMIYSWETKHTVVENKRLAFDGNAVQLFGKWILWWLLSVVTLGIYALWIPIRLKAWRTKHTYFVKD